MSAHPPKSWQTAFLGLGSNIGDKRGNVSQAIERLTAGSAIKLCRRASDYITPPWGDLAQEEFCNSAVVVETILTPSALLHWCLAVEKSVGRKQTRKWGPRVIDIDILTYGEAVIRLPDLILPHPHMGERAFVLVPLVEIAPDFRLADGRLARLVAPTLSGYEGIQRL